MEREKHEDEDENGEGRTVRARKGGMCCSRKRRGLCVIFVDKIMQLAHYIVSFHFYFNLTKIIILTSLFLIDILKVPMIYLKGFITIKC